MDEEKKYPTVEQVSAIAWETVALQAEPLSCSQIAHCLFSKATMLETESDLIGASYAASLPKLLSCT